MYSTWDPSLRRGANVPFHICTYVLYPYGVHTYIVASSWASRQQIVVKSGETETTQAWVADGLCKEYGLLRTE